MSALIRLERRDDRASIRDVIRLAFGGEGEGELVDRLRAQGYAKLSLVAEVEAAIVGHILFSELPIVTQDGAIKALALAPMAVTPARQRQGVGTKLVRQGLRLCRDQGYRAVVVLGHPEYYPRFGFSAKLAERLSAPSSGEAFMALELVPGALGGVEGEVRYPPPFDAV